MTDFIIVRDWGDFFLRDDTEIRRSSGETFADQIEGYSLFQRKPYGRVHVYGGPLEWALTEAEKEVNKQRKIRKILGAENEIDN